MGGRRQGLSALFRVGPLTGRRVPVLVLALVALSLPAAARPTELPRVISTPAGWVAPGALLEVSGWTASRASVSLLVDGRRAARTSAGPLGRFQVSWRAPGPGRYRLAVVSAGRRLPAGSIRVRPLLLAAVGDVNLGDGPGAAIAVRGPRHPWLSVARLLRAADLGTANLECAVSRRGSPVAGKPFTFRGTPAALRAAVRFAGLDVLSVANNHSLDFGPTAFLDTLRVARRLGVALAGGGESLAAARRPAILVRGGLRLAFLGYSDIPPADFFARPGRPGTAPAGPALVAADVRRARRLADLVVVWFHWGIERRTTPDGRQRALAAAALGAGATLVLGAHPHVLQPIERRGRRLVAWSLGNFVFTPVSPGTDRTGVLLVRLDARGVRGLAFRPARIVGVQPRLRAAGS